MLPELAKKRMDGIITESTDAQFKLEMQPATTMEYVEALTFLDEIQERVETLESQSQIVEKMYELINNYDVPTPPEDFAVFKVNA